MLNGRVPSKCCRSTPRCRACPVVLAAELAAMLPTAEAVPPHLAGLPACLHKYEPLFRRAAEQDGGRAAAAR